MGESPDLPEDAIVRSWHVNAAPWAAALQARSIASRRLVTDAAILEAVRSVRPRRVLDVGCGEGWLTRALDRMGIDVTGIDVVPELIARAQSLGAGDFRVLSYQELATTGLGSLSFDAAVCNFSLLGNESVESLIGSMGTCLAKRGHLIVQTLHPVVACGEQAYRDGWRPGSWAGFGPEFSRPPPWYFRTAASWYAMLRRHGFELVECREPTAHDAAAPSSILFICQHRGMAAQE